jgi:hypothetical protein
MSDVDGKVLVAVLALRESTPSTLYGMCEVLESAGRDWRLLIDGTPGESVLKAVPQALSFPASSFGCEWHCRALPSGASRLRSRPVNFSTGKRTLTKPCGRAAESCAR